MNILLVNPSHPEVKHVSAVRAWRFATELARRSHHVVLLSAAPQDQETTAGAGLEDHDWSSPCVLAPAAEDAAVAASRPALLRRGETLFRMVTSGGRQVAWAKAAVILAVAQSSLFRPDVIWATYGKMEAVFVAKRVARHFKVPWVLDLKDNWNLYVPNGLRRLMSWRTRGWSALTANGELTRDQGRRWQRALPTLIYSGVDYVFLTPQDVPPATRQILPLNLVGGLYFDQPLRILLEGVSRWAEARSASQAPVMLAYYGVDEDRLQAAATGLRGKVSIETKGYVDPATLAAACQDAAANLYIGHPGTFHHKTLELLACGRPLLVCPRERDESRRLAAQVAGTLIEAATPAAVADALHRIDADWRQWTGPAPNPAVSRFSWSAQTELLEQVLFHVANG